MFFFKELDKKKNTSGNLISNTLILCLLKCHFFFSIDDLKFFLKKGSIYVNNRVVINPLFSLEVGDKIQLVFSSVYFNYANKINKFFKKKIKFLKYKRWRFFKFFIRNKYKKWSPEFLNKFFFYKKDIPTTFEIDFLTLTIIYIKHCTNIFKYDFNLLRVINSYFNKSYSWKRIT